MESRGWEVTGYNNFKPEELSAPTFKMPDKNVVISNGFYET
jgi:hypothetical protein